MKVELNLFASLARYAPGRSGRRGPRTMEIEAETTIIELLNQLKVPLESVKILFLNGVHARGDEVLSEGDRIGVFPPVAGG